MSEQSKPLRVLVVDDDQVDREIVRRALRRTGAATDVLEAGTGDEALAILVAQPIDCVFLDYNIPGSDGLALLSAIRERARAVPVVALTGHGDERVAVELMKAGAADYVAKAEATPERLATSLRYATELARAQAQAQAAEDELRAGATRSRFLAEASAALARSLDVRATLERVAELSVPILGDYCVIYLIGPEGLRGVASAHRDASKRSLVRLLEQSVTAPPDGAMSGISEVIRTGRTKVFEEITAGQLDAGARDMAERDAYRALAPRSVVFVPVVARTLMGVALFARGVDRAAFGPQDVSLAEDLANRAATALENGQLFQEVAQARDEAEQARRDAEEANRAKSQFLARMSHDLRTPLNAIAGYAQLISEGIYGEPTAGQRESLGRIRRAQQHLLTLINDVLSFAKLEAGQVHLAIDDVLVQPSLGSLGALIEPQAQAKGLTLEVRAPAKGLMVRADPERLTQILLNLLTNAVKFTDEGGQIVLSAEATSRGVAIAVGDSGRGIPAEKLETIFTPFVQGQQGAEEERHGVGLGLAIGRELARMMQGELHAESIVGRGSTFTLTLPAVDGSETAGHDEKAHEAVGTGAR